MKAFLSKINRIYWIIGAVLLLGIIALLIFWNMNARANRAAGQFQTYEVVRSDLTQSIGGTGSVRAKQSALLTWQTSGQVGTVDAEIGDRVSTDQVLAALNPGSLPQAVIQAGVDLATAQVELAQATDSNTGLANAEQAVVTARQTLEDAQNELDSMNFPRASDSVIQNADGQITLAEKSLARAADRYRGLSHLSDDNATKAEALVAMTNAQLNLNTLIANYNWYSGTPTSLELAQAQAARDVAKAALSDAERTLQTYKDGGVPADMAAAQAKVAIAQAALNQAKIIAPFAGVITAAHPNPGDLVSSGTEAFRIDNVAQLLVDVPVSEVDINHIEVDMPVTMQFDAILGKTYNGKVVKVNLAGDTASNAVTFTVTTEIIDADEQVKPGMSATVSIIVQQTENALVVPNRALTNLDGKHTVRVLRNGIPSRVEVEIGTATDSVTEIVGGDLNEGDTIVLTTGTAANDAAGPGGGAFFRARP